jgi:hypothetical protein
MSFHDPLAFGIVVEKSAIVLMDLPQKGFLREEYAGYVTPCSVLVVVPITSFLPSVRRLEEEILLLNQGSGVLLQVQ